ncbi:DUF305 domain-containing protein [Deinococcus pimensis]|uniref:DUF305 domain-containing protein n=1 Tax=Deinococcus pimensis TaxID=309888 RepID=UPI00047FE403|nr:DUF305 domain-containing protein [Deinococcus pimensis]
MPLRVRWLLALIVLAVVAGGALLLAPRASSVSADSPGARFAYEMTQHHLQAIDMAVRLHDRTRDERLKSLTLDIILSQQDQVGQMRGWLSTWGLPWSGQGMTEEHARTMGMASAADVRALSTLPVADAERSFLTLMIRHHQGALVMTKDFLGERLPAPAGELARQIQAAQGAEITLMRGMLAARGGREAPAPSGDAHDDMSGMPGMKH